MAFPAIFLVKAFQTVILEDCLSPQRMLFWLLLRAMLDFELLVRYIMLHIIEFEALFLFIDAAVIRHILLSLRLSLESDLRFYEGV